LKFKLLIYFFIKCNNIHILLKVNYICIMTDESISNDIIKTLLKIKTCTHSHTCCHNIAYKIIQNLDTINTITSETLELYINYMSRNYDCKWSKHNINAIIRILNSKSKIVPTNDTLAKLIIREKIDFFIQ
jgi:hypothetical protein